MVVFFLFPCITDDDKMMTTMTTSDYIQSDFVYRFVLKHIIENIHLPFLCIVHLHIVCVSSIPIILSSHIHTMRAENVWIQGYNMKKKHFFPSIINIMFFFLRIRRTESGNNVHATITTAWWCIKRNRIMSPTESIATIYTASVELQ